MLSLIIYLILLSVVLVSDLGAGRRLRALSPEANNPMQSAATGSDGKRNLPSVFSTACLVLGLVTYSMDLVSWKFAASTDSYLAQQARHGHTIELLFGIPALLCALAAFLGRERFRWFTLFPLLGFLGGLL